MIATEAAYLLVAVVIAVAIALLANVVIERAITMLAAG